MHHSHQKYTGISKGTAILGSKERMTPLHANSSLLCGKTTLCRDLPACLVLHVFFLRPSAAVVDRIRCAPIDTRSNAIPKFCRNCDQNTVSEPMPTIFASEQPSFLVWQRLVRYCRKCFSAPIRWCIRGLFCLIRWCIRGLYLCFLALCVYVKPVAQCGFEIKQAACLDYVYCKIFEAQLPSDFLSSPLSLEHLHEYPIFLPNRRYLARWEKNPSPTTTNPCS